MIAPAVSKKLAKYTLGDQGTFGYDDEFNEYADSIGEPDLSWYEDDEELPEEPAEDEAPADEV